MPKTTPTQATEALAKEPQHLKKTDISSGKQSAGHDVVSLDVNETFRSERPSLIIGERQASKEFNVASQTQAAFNKVSGLQVRMGNDFEHQFNSEYMSRIFPWALNYSCGGADYQDLFNSWEDLTADNRSTLFAGRHRRPPDAPILSPGSYAQMLATRCEAQLGSDWLLVPAARNLHWRFTVLQNAFGLTMQQMNLDPDLEQQVSTLLDNMRWIWEAYSKNIVTIKGEARYINGNFRLLLQDDNITDTAKTILHGWIKTTENVPGCQALRKKNGRILFGFRVTYGESIFVTVTPNRRNSALLLYLSRARANDTCFKCTRSSTQYRKRHCGFDSPKFISNESIASDENGNRVRVEVPVPSMLDRQKLVAEDPLATAHHFQVIMRIVVPGIFGLRMCLRCPHCNIDTADPDCKIKPGVKIIGCSNCLGCNQKLLGGYAGLATSMGFSVEYTKEGTPHAHGLVALNNLYSTNSLWDIGAMLLANGKSCATKGTENANALRADSQHTHSDGESFVCRMKNFVNHLQRSSHMDQEHHNNHQDMLEDAFHRGQDESKYPMFSHLSSRPAFLFESAKRINQKVFHGKRNI